MIPSLTRNCSYSEHRDHAIKINQICLLKPETGAEAIK